MKKNTETPAADSMPWWQILLIVLGSILGVFLFAALPVILTLLHKYWLMVVRGMTENKAHKVAFAPGPLELSNRAYYGRKNSKPYNNE